MSCSSSSSASLLQLQRPTTRSRSACRATDRGVGNQFADGTCTVTTPFGPRTSSTHSMIALESAHHCSEHRRCSSPTPSASSGIHYLNVDPTCSMSTDLAESEMASEHSELQSSCASLRSVAAGAMGQGLPKHKWQPDSDSSLCSYDLCSTIFGPPTYLSVGPRRHHCRLCGLLYCHEHSRTRAPLSTVDKHGATIIFRARVCDTCVEKKHSGLTLSRTASMDTTSSQPSEYLITPPSEHDTSSEPSNSRRSSRVDPEADDAPPSPPVEPWMGRDAILSLYPLAANSSRSTVKLPPSAAPLFAPSRSERRTARDKELERLTLRRRRMAKNHSFLLSCGTDDEDEAEVVHNDSILVRDGPICYRTKVSRYPARVMSRTDMSALCQ